MELNAYGKAGSIAEEVFSSMRTVVSYNGQEREEKRFNFNKRYSHCCC
jgi:ATP-binding cassette subfamily B (MDR/TAP) protein 1